MTLRDVLGNSLTPLAASAALRALRLLRKKTPNEKIPTFFENGNFWKMSGFFRILLRGYKDLPFGLESILKDVPTQGRKIYKQYLDFFNGYDKFQ